MDLGDCRASIVAEEDRLSNLPDEIIHRILSFLDMKDAIQTSQLSRKWKNMWTSMPHLNLTSTAFHTLPNFAKFVKQVLSHRNNLTEVSSLKLTFRGAATQFAVQSILDYAYSHNVEQLMIVWLTAKYCHLPQHFVSSHTLKHLTLVAEHLEGYFPGCYMPKSAWDLPVLETLNVRNVQIEGNEKSINLFSKCVNLKDLTLHNLRYSGYCLETFIVCAPQLRSLTITGNVSFAKVFNVVAPQLENLTLTVNSESSFHFVELSSKGSKSVEKVKLSLSVCKFPDEAYFSALLDLFQKLCNAKYLILDVNIIQILSSCLDQISCQPCPFDDLKCLKINTGCVKQKDSIETIPAEVGNYFLENSPSATLITDLPLEPQKRLIDEVPNDIMANKVARLEAKRKFQDEVIAAQKTKIQMQDEVIAEHKSNIQILKAAKLQHENFMSHILKCKMAELRIQIESGNPDFDVICSVCSDIKSLMDLIPENLRISVLSQFSSQYEEFKRCFNTQIDASHWVKIGTGLGIVRGSDSEISCSNNINIQRLKETVAILQENENALRQELEAQRVSTEQQVKTLQDQVTALMWRMVEQFQPCDPPFSLY